MTFNNWQQMFNMFNSSDSLNLYGGFGTNFFGGFSFDAAFNKPLFSSDMPLFTGVDDGSLFTVDSKLSTSTSAVSDGSYNEYNYTLSSEAAFDAAVQRAYDKAKAKKSSSSTSTKSSSGVSSSSVPSTSSATSASNVSTVISNEALAQELKQLGYNPEKAKNLATLALKETETDTDGNKKSVYQWVGYCATKVKRAMQSAGLGGYEAGHAYAMVDQLSQNKNFKRLSTTNVDLNSLPAGCIIVYGKGVARYSKDYGHVEITVGNGTAASDFINSRIRPNPTAIFVPV